MSAAPAKVARRVASAGLVAAFRPPVTDALLGRDRLTVLAYHRIADVRSPDMVWDPGVVSATPEMFERQMRHMAREFNVISLGDLHEHLTGGRRLPRRPALVTFDDGYRDNYDEAFPVLRRLALPAVVFIVTGAIGTDRVMWWDELSYLLGRTEARRAELPLVGERDVAGPGAGATRDALLAALKAVPDDERAAAMAGLRDALGVAAPRPPTPMFMGWDEVSELVAHGVECQPHTVDHPILLRVPDERARREIAGSAREAAERTGRPALAFAYPNGDYDAGTMAALRDAGIGMAFTMRLGPCSPEAARRAPLEIPRVPVLARDGWDAFRLKVSGAASVVLRGLRRLPPARGGTA